MLRFLIIFFCISTRLGLSTAAAQTVGPSLNEAYQIELSQTDLDLRLSAFPDLFETPTGLVWGAQDAPIRIIGFFDYTTLLSKRLFSQMPVLVEQNPDLRIELRELPRGSSDANRLARFALATRLVHGDDGYRAMHLHLLRMQEIPTRHILGLIAQEGGLTSIALIA